jgi:SAM-dependent methyltransferase
MGPHGRALEDEFRGRRCHDLAIVRDDGHAGTVPVSLFLSETPVFPQEVRVLDGCRGRVLDVGAGGGRHALLLQSRGLEVCAIDVVPQAVTIMRERGVRDARLLDFLDYHETGFDTALLLGHGLGLAGDLAGLERWLDHLEWCLAPGGQVLADSFDVRCTEDPVHLSYSASLEAQGRYRGEMRFHLEYGDLVGPEFGWLHVDFDTLARLAASRCWRAERLDGDDDGNYWCCLERVC